MRILFINQYFHPDLASTGQLLTELCTSLAKRFDVTVVAGFPSYTAGANRTHLKSPVRMESHDGVKVIRTYNTSLPRGSSIGRIANYLSFFLSSFFGAVFLAGKPDVVVTMTDPPVIALTGYIVSRIRKARFVFISQDVFPEVSKALGKMDYKPLVWLLDRLNRFLLRKSDQIVAIGETMRKRLIEKGADPDKVAIIENWVDTDLIAPQDRSNPFSHEHKLTGKFVVMHSGNIGLSQDLETLIEAASLLKDNDEVVFAIIGDGVSKDKLSKLVDKLSLANVKFIPYQNKEDLKHSLSSADVSVVSLKKGLAGYIVPSKLHGILASGRTVLAAVEDECEVAKIVKDENCGKVIQPGNPQEMVDAIMHFLKNPDLLEEHGRNARDAGEKKYSRKQAMDKYEDLLVTVTNGNKD
ncbi:MAG: glycosyltransferase family 4 protein [Candidatus Eisenbacteria bacterium]